MTRGLRIVLDASHLDHLSVAQGQFRYLVDLLRGLSELDTNTEFVVLGSVEDPVADIAPLVHQPRWRYRCVRPWRFRGGAVLAYARYAALLRRERPDVFHAVHTFVPLAAPCPVCVTLFDMMYERFPEYQVAVRSRPYRVYRWAVRRVVDRALCISASTAQDLAALWSVPASRIAVVPLGTDVERWRRLAQARSDTIDGLTHTEPTVASVYNLEPRKNLGALLRAVRLLRHDVPGLRLLLFGRAAATPGREAAFERTLRDLGLEETVVRCGVLADPALARLYRRATVFVYPSLYEGFGLPLLEAMASGGCVVARAASAMAEVVGDAGVLTDVATPSALAATLASVLRDPARRDALRAAARTRAAGFTIRAMAQATHDVYRSLAGAAHA